MTIWSDYFSLSTVYILTKDNMIDIPKNSVSRILELIPNSSIRIAVFHKDIAADIEIPKEIKTSSKLLLRLRLINRNKSNCRINTIKK